MSFFLLWNNVLPVFGSCLNTTTKEKSILPGNEKILELGLPFGVPLGEATGVTRGEELIVPVNKIDTYYDVKGCISDRAAVQAVVSND